MNDNALSPGDTLDQTAPESKAIRSVFGDLVAPLNRLAMTAGSEFSIDDMLRDLCRTAIETLTVDGAGIMATHDTGLRFVHASETLVAVEQWSSSCNKTCRKARAKPARRRSRS
ncbi:hypothetical protein BH24ACT11_BH24ACT11_14560 [soil metagenome]